MKKTTSPKTSKVDPRGLSNPLGHRSPQPGSGDPGRANSGVQSLILGALLVAGLSLALACCGTLDPQVEAKPAVTATLTAQATERPAPTSTSTATPIAAPRWPTSPSPPCNRTSIHCFWTRSGSNEPLNHDNGVLQRTKGTLPDPSGLVETR
jgi:hypothetical protein